MELNDYQKKAMSTCLDTCDNFSYMMLNLVGEVGEFSSKIAKAIRRRYIAIGKMEKYEQSLPNGLIYDKVEPSEAFEFYDELRLEAGDIMWQIAGLCYVFGWKLEDICQMNLDKLAARKHNNTIDGNGDHR